MDKRFISTAVFCLMAWTARAEQVPAVFVYSDEDGAEDIACSIRGASIVAAVESELRHNRISIATQDQYNKAEAISAAIVTTSLELSGGLCVTGYELSLENGQYVTVDVTNERRFAKVVFCAVSGVMSGAGSGMQGRLNTQFRDLTSECVSEYLAKSGR